MNMSDRKSGRTRKLVDYTKFGDGDELDDDFADSTPPASKKAKLSNKENKDKKNKKTVQRKEKEEKQKRSSKRSPVDDRLYERELQEALELSLSQSDPSDEPTEAHTVTTISEEHPPIIIDDEDNVMPSPILPAVENPPVLQRITDEEDEIQVLERDIDVVPSSRQKASKAKRYIIDSDSENASEDSDFAPGHGDISSDDDDDEASDDGDDDYNAEDSDSDFGSSKKKKPTKKTTVKSSKGPAKTSKESKSTAEPTKASSPTAIKTKSTQGCTKASGTPTPLASSSPSSRTPPAKLTARKAPNWKAPGVSSDVRSPVLSKTRPTMSGSVGTLPLSDSGVRNSPLGGVNIKSPSSGLRLGLSRNMKLKPLHPNLKIHN